MPVPAGRPPGSRAEREPAFDPTAHLRPERPHHPVREPDRGQQRTREGPAPAASREPARHRDRRQRRVERRVDPERSGHLEPEHPARAATVRAVEAASQRESRDDRVGAHPHPVPGALHDEVDGVEVDQEGVGRCVVGTIGLAVEIPRGRLTGDREPGVVDDESARDRLDAACPHRREQPPELLDDEERVSAPHQHEIALEAPVADRAGHAHVRLPPMGGPELLERDEGGEELDRRGGIPGDAGAMADERRLRRHVLHPHAQRLRGKAVACERRPPPARAAPPPPAPAGSASRNAAIRAHRGSRAGRTAPASGMRRNDRIPASARARRVRRPRRRRAR